MRFQFAVLGLLFPLLMSGVSHADQKREDILVGSFETEGRTNFVVTKDIELPFSFVSVPTTRKDSIFRSEMKHTSFQILFFKDGQIAKSKVVENPLHDPFRHIEIVFEVVPFDIDAEISKNINTVCAVAAVRTSKNKKPVITKGTTSKLHHDGGGPLGFNLNNMTLDASVGWHLANYTLPYSEEAGEYSEDSNMIRDVQCQRKENHFVDVLRVQDVERAFGDYIKMITPLDIEQK